VPRHIEIDEIKIADQQARQCSSHPITGPELAYGTYARVATGVIRNWTHRKHEEYWQSTVEQRQAKGFLKSLSAKRTKALPVEAKNIDRAADMTLSPVSTSIQTALVDNPRYGRCKQANGTTSHVLCYCEPLKHIKICAPCLAFHQIRYF